MSVEHDRRVRQLIRLKRGDQKTQQSPPGALQPTWTDATPQDAGQVQEIVTVDQYGHGSIRSARDHSVELRSAK
jgi:hypothetical protein